MTRMCLVWVIVEVFTLSKTHFWKCMCFLHWLPSLWKLHITAPEKRAKIQRELFMPSFNGCCLNLLPFLFRKVLIVTLGSTAIISSTEPNKHGSSILCWMETRLVFLQQCHIQTFSAAAAKNARRCWEKLWLNSGHFLLKQLIFNQDVAYLSKMRLQDFPCISRGIQKMHIIHMMHWDYVLHWKMIIIPVTWKKRHLRKYFLKKRATKY